MIPKLIGIAIIFLVFLFSSSTIHASENFTTDYTVTYTIAEDGKTHATLKGSLTNTTSQYYATSYKMQLGFDEISNVKASDPAGPFTPTVTKTETGYSIGLTFNKKIVGAQKSLPFTITFDTSTVAKRYGKVWEINIPGIANPGNFASFTVKVVTPPSFGKPTYIKPAQANNELTFTKEQLGKSGISIAFGDKQLYSFQLAYHLSNDNIYPITTEIALPPTTNYQEVAITDISPRPKNVKEDKDGNWLATYWLLPAQNTDVLVKGIAEVSLTPKESLLSPEDKALYLKEQPYWQTSNAEIRELARSLKTPEAIYHYVVKTLTYDFSRVTDDKPRLGAVDSLRNPDSAVCREFTDLFIAIARAANIPAREVNGFAYTENEKQRPLSLVQDILHAWPEYYDEQKKTWVMVDPTWGNTTGGIDYFSVLDVDHFAFVMKGIESNYPIPAGGYKRLDSRNKKDISVSFATTPPILKTDALIKTSFSKNAIAGLPITGEITVTNTGTKKISAQVLSLQANGLTPQEQVLTTKGIPPFGSQTWKATFDAQPLLTKKNARISVSFAADSEVLNKSGEHMITISPFFLNIWVIGGIVISMLFIVLVIGISNIRRVKL